ncbi:neo-calmodulin-like [Ruditapes philippinarum]|uniref:neo-calmodulin-like n=1 Tax=Ruditapes philippinarum TaxID=129788 RepID=UPI00295ABCEC|nr:neo-calmodulin-like [Ruditapes philippinarum]
MEQRKAEDQQGLYAQANEKPELTTADIEEMKTWFKFFDKNNDKQLDKEELKMVFHALCWTVNEEEVDRLFKLADTDQNGYIDYEEYIAFLKLYKKDPELEKLELREAFRHFDKDRSGFIDHKELRRFLMSKGHAYSDRERKEVDRILKMADSNGDGKIDIEEFITVMLEKPDASLYSGAKF